MANVFARSLHGDGISLNFFRHLWSKNRKEEGKGEGATSESSRKDEGGIYSLRVPDTVIFQLGQPLQWYFTSCRSRQPTILRKKKQNLNTEKIEQEFIRKSRVAKKSPINSNDIIAYFIASSEKSATNRTSGGGCNKRKTQVRGRHSDILNEESNITSAEDEDQEDNVCSIEYFNKETLHTFLQERCRNKTGILQHFIKPSLGGIHNSQIRAICTPNVYHFERRRTKEELHDPRFGLYERAVTFDGPEVHSISVPIQGKALPGKLRKICKTVLNHLSEASMCDVNRTGVCAKGNKEVVRIVMHIKLDSDDRVWLLYSSSIRLVPKVDQFPDWKVHKTICTSPQGDLNIKDLIKLPPSIRLNQNANHDPAKSVSNKHTFTTCPSCFNNELEETFQPLPYRTIISHYEQVLALAKDDTRGWPSYRDIIKRAGGVGFGTLKEKNRCSTKGDQTNLQYGEDNTDIAFDEWANAHDVIIPPVIRYLHSHYNADSYKKKRADPLFLHKHCDMCENCFLSYANLASTSFQITRPVQLDNEASTRRDIEDLFNVVPAFDPNVRGTETKKKKNERRRELSGRKKELQYTLAEDLLISPPKFPSAILQPPAKTLDIEQQHIVARDDKTNMMLLLERERVDPIPGLEHMIKAQQALENSVPLIKKKIKIELNPYEVPLKFICPNSPSHKKIKKKKKNSCVNKNREEETYNGDNLTGSVVDWKKTEYDLNLLSNTLADMSSKERKQGVTDESGTVSSSPMVVASHCIMPSDVVRQKSKKLYTA